MAGNGEQRQSELDRPLSMRAIVIGGALVVVMGAAAVTALLYFYGGGTEQDRAGLDPVSLTTEVPHVPEEARKPMGSARRCREDNGTCTVHHPIKSKYGRSIMVSSISSASANELANPSIFSMLTIISSGSVRRARIPCAVFDFSS
jgi:hypothetical protein